MSQIILIAGGAVVVCLMAAGCTLPTASSVQDVRQDSFPSDQRTTPSRASANDFVWRRGESRHVATLECGQPFRYPNGWGPVTISFALPEVDRGERRMLTFSDGRTIAYFSTDFREGAAEGDQYFFNPSFNPNSSVTTLTQFLEEDTIAPLRVGTLETVLIDGKSVVKVLTNSSWEEHQAVLLYLMPRYLDDTRLPHVYARLALSVPRSDLFTTDELRSLLEDPEVRKEVADFEAVLSTL